MFDLVHKYKRVMQVLLMLIAISFMGWGVESYTRMRGDRDAVASIDGLEITGREFEEAVRRQQDQLRQMLGRNFDPAQFDTPDSREALLDRMIDERVVASAALKSHLTVSDDALVETIHSIPAFRGPDGSFSKPAYEEVLRRQNPPLSPSQYEARLRYELSLTQLSRAVGESAIPSRTVSERLAALEAQQREIAEARIPTEQFLPKVKIDDAKIKAYYDANQAQFQIPERVKAEYVMLSAEAMAAEETVKPDEVRKQWETTVGPRMREKDEARRKAQEIAAALRKDPKSFAEVAKKESQDPGSRDNGGDLGFTARGTFVKAYEDALYRMKQGQISDPVESEFGFHVIHLTGIQRKDGREERRSSHILIPTPQDVKPFEAMREQIEADLKKARAGRRFGEAANELQNVVYEQADSLKPAAERFNLKIQTTGWIAKAANQELGALDNPKLIAALFSSDSLRNKRNTDAIEVAPNTLVSARVLEHQPAAQRKLEEVKNEIAALLQRQEAADLARKEGAARLEQLRKGADAGVKWSLPRNVSRREAKGMPGELLRPIMSADVSKLPAYVGLPVGDSGYVLVRISKVLETDPKQAGDAVQRTSGLAGASQYEAYVASLRKQADVSINRANLEKKQQQ